MLRKFRDWETFTAYKEGRWPIYCTRAKIMFVDKGGEHSISDEPRLYELLVQACEKYFRQEERERG